MPGCGSVQLGRVGRHQANIRQIAKALCVIHSIADHEVVRNTETDIVGVDLFQPPRRLVEQSGDAKRTRLVPLKETAQKRKREPGIEDVFDQDDVFVLDRLVEILDELDGSARSLSFSVARDGDEVEGAGQADGAREVGEKDGRALEHSNQYHGLTVVISIDLAAKLGYARLNLFAAVEDGEGLVNVFLAHSSSVAKSSWEAAGFGAVSSLTAGRLYTSKFMYPYIHIGRFSVGTFGILLWFAAVCGCWVLHRNFRRWKIDADAIGIVAIATVAGVVGAKLWHVGEEPRALIHDFWGLVLDRAGFAWYGGLVGAILALIWQGRNYRISGLAMLDLSAAAAAIGYGVGRIGCLVSGDGDYGIPTSLPWGMSFPNGLVPTTQRVHPTPIYELIGALVIGWILWRRGAPDRPKAIGQLTGEYLIYSGIARFLVEFIRINPRIYWGMSNAQVASIASVICGALLIVAAKSRGAVFTPPVTPEPAPASAE